ncbi:MAG: light-harvesting antenna LH1, alpha subunit [Parvularculaceae bacterium]
MWKIWLLFDPRRALVAILTFAFLMVMLMHFIMLSTDRFNFLGGAPAAPATAMGIESNDATRQA